MTITTRSDLDAILERINSLMDDPEKREELMCLVDEIEVYESMTEHWIEEVIDAERCL